MLISHRIWEIVLVVQFWEIRVMPSKHVSCQKVSVAGNDLASGLGKNSLRGGREQLTKTEHQSQSLTGRLYCTPKAFWKLSWFLKDFGYDTDLLGKEETPARLAARFE
jgi:hypothetical protein